MLPPIAIVAHTNHRRANRSYGAVDDACAGSSLNPVSSSGTTLTRSAEALPTGWNLASYQITIRRRRTGGNLCQAPIRWSGSFRERFALKTRVVRDRLLLRTLPTFGQSKPRSKVRTRSNSPEMHCTTLKGEPMNTQPPISLRHKLITLPAGKTVGCSPSERHDIVLLFGRHEANPNGDPDTGNMPFRNQTHFADLVTDVCLSERSATSFHSTTLMGCCDQNPPPTGANTKFHSRMRRPSATHGVA